MKQNGWIIWQVHLLFPWADGCLLACWQVYDKVFAIFNQVSSFTPISGPAQKQGRAEIKRTQRRGKEQVCNKSLDEIVSFDNNNMRAVCPPSACLLISPVQPWPPDTAHYCKSVDITTVISTYSNIPSLPRSLWSFVWQIIARFSELPSAVSTVLSVRAGLECDPLLAPLNSEHSKLSWFSGDAAE